MIHHRIKGVMQNSPEFAAAFGCKKGDKMFTEKKCRIW